MCLLLKSHSTRCELSKFLHACRFTSSLVAPFLLLACIFYPATHPFLSPSSFYSYFIILITLEGHVNIDRSSQFPSPASAAHLRSTHTLGNIWVAACCWVNIAYIAYIVMLHVYNLGQHVVNKLKEKVCFQGTMLLKCHSHQMFLKSCPNVAYSDRLLAFWCTVIINIL